MLSKAQVKYIQSFSDKKFRDSEKAFIAEGPKLVSEWLRERPGDVLAIYALPEWVEEEATLLKKTGIRASVVEPFELEKISHLSTPNHVLAVIRKPSWPVEPALDKGISLYLDDIQDPGNLGTILRTADWFGVQQVICSPATADPFSAKVVQSTMGSLMRVRVHYAEPDDMLAMAGTLPIWAAALDGQPMKKLNIPSSLVLVIGNESKGIRPSLLSRATQRVTIPGKGGAESLNAAVATGILLAHLTEV
jgi:RNA methyltransferase, TrmH family